MCKMVCQVNGKALIEKNLASGFKKTGIWPCSFEALPKKKLPDCLSTTVAQVHQSASSTEYYSEITLTASEVSDATESLIPTPAPTPTSAPAPAPAPTTTSPSSPVLHVPVLVQCLPQKAHHYGMIRYHS